MDTILNLTGLILLILATLIIAYYAPAVSAEGAFGARYVTKEIRLFFPLSEITSFKPITLITYLVFAGTALILEANKKLLARVDTRGLRVIIVTVSFAAGYELIWNFLAWFTVWEINGGILDLAANQQHNYAFLPVNFNFATKTSYLVFALCLYSWYFLKGLHKEKANRRQR